MPRITILMDDRVGTTRPRGLQAEHGLAIAIDDVLFDTGQTGTAAANARLLGRTPEYTTIVLSHGHYDHTGGLPAFLPAADELYAHPAVFAPKFRDGEFIGNPYRRDHIAAGVEITTHTDVVEVAPDIFALGEIPRSYADHPTGMTATEAGDRVPDPLNDDQSLVIDAESGLLLICGCCHAGLRNTVEYAETVFEQPVRGVIGGTHLLNADEETIHAVAEFLDGRVELLAPSHCTGQRAERILATQLPEAYTTIGVGSEIVW